MKVYVYAVQGPPETLQAWARSLGAPLYHWVADAAQLTMGPDIPEDWKDQGAVFGPKGELRWWREGPDCRALLLTDKPVDGLRPLGGDWMAQDGDFFLQDLNDRKLQPNFATYPHGFASGRCRARVYYCNGVATFISPRELIEEGGHNAKR